MEWNPLTSENQIEQIIEKSAVRPQLIFKHSTRCSISSVVKDRLERTKTPDHIDFYFLDLIANRPVSNAIAERLSVHHESPQVLLVKNGECVYEESHMSIRMDDIVAQTTAA